jgi:hypothetical protein
VLLDSVQPLSKRDPERHARIKGLSSAELALYACTERSYVCPLRPARSKLGKEGARMRAQGRATRWLTRWVSAAKALRKIPHLATADIFDVPRPGRVRPARAIMMRIEVVRPLFLDLLQNGDAARKRILRDLTRLFLGDPDSFPAQAWFFDAVAFELHVVSNEQRLSDEERESRDVLLGVDARNTTDPIDLSARRPSKFCGGDSRYPETEWMLLPAAVRASGWSETTVKRRRKELPAEDRGETEPKPRLVVRISALRKLVETEGRPWKGPESASGD